MYVSFQYQYVQQYSRAAIFRILGTVALKAYLLYIKSTEVTQQIET
jgi:hypothetical protein